MYPVSDAYKQALLGKCIEDRISGTVTLADGSLIELSDGVLVRNSLKITHELCRDYKIGTFNLGCLQIAFFDSNALLRDFSEASVAPVYEIKTSEGWERVPLGIYIADGNTVRRKRNTVSLTAYDRGLLFDRVIPDSLRESRRTAAGFIQLACTKCGVSLAGIAAGLPNTSVSLSLSNRQVQTYRDLVAWCASLLCGYAMIDRTGNLKIIPAKYGVAAQDYSVITIDKYLTEKERDSIYVTDTRAYISTLNAYCGDQLKAYVSDAAQEDEQAAAAVYRLAKNPLIPADLTESACDAINRSWLDYIDGFKQRGVTAQIYGDPAIDAGDALRCSGGDIDQRRSIVGLVTRQEWRYRAFHTVICAAPQLYGKVTQNADVVVNQLEKKISGISYTGGRGVSVSDGRIEANIGEGLDFDSDGKIISTGAHEYYYGRFRLRDVCDAGGTRYPIMQFSKKPLFIIVTEHSMLSSDPDSSDFLRHNVWMCGTNMTNQSTYGECINIEYVNAIDTWQFGFGVPISIVTDSSASRIFFERHKNRDYDYFVLCE